MTECVEGEVTCLKANSNKTYIRDLCRRAMNRGVEKNYIKRGLMIATDHQILFG